MLVVVELMIAMVFGISSIVADQIGLNPGNLVGP